MYDLLIIGAGPGGIALGVEAEAAGVPADRILLLEKSPQHSWTIRSLYPESKPVTANYKGIDAVCEGIMCLSDTTKEETITYLDRAIQESGLRVEYEREVQKIEPLESGGGPLFKVYSGADVFTSKLVVIAIGIFGRPNKPSYSIPRELKDRIHFDINSINGKGEKILVVGGGDSAGEFFQFLVQRDNTVSLSYRRASFSKMNRINEESVLALHQREKAEILWSSNIHEVQISGTGKPLVVFEEEEYGCREYDRIVYALGGSTPQNFLSASGIEFVGGAPLIDEAGESNIPGLFVTGDLAAGKRGGSIAAAFNASRSTMGTICENYLECKLQPLAPPPVPEINNPARLHGPAEFTNGTYIGNLVLQISGRGRSRLRHLQDSRFLLLYLYHGNWCRECRNFFTAISAMRKEFDAELQIIAVSTNSYGDARELIKEHRLWFPVAYNADENLAEYIPFFMNLERGCFEPAFFILDENSHVLHTTLISSAGAKPDVASLLKTARSLKSHLLKK